MQGLPVARGFIPAGLQSSPKTCHHSFYRPTACEQIAPAAQPSGDKSPHHKDAVHIPGCCLCEERTPCGWQIYQSCRDSLWRGDSSPLGCKAAPKPATTVSTGTPRVSKWRLLRSRAGINPLTTKILFTSRDVVCVEGRTPCGWQIYQSCRDSLWRGDSSPLGWKAAPKPATTVSTGPPHVSKLRLLRSRAGINPLTTKILFTSRDVVCVEERIPVASRFISLAGTPCGEGIHPRWAAKQPQNLPPQFLQALRV